MDIKNKSLRRYIAISIVSIAGVLPTISYSAPISGTVFRDLPLSGAAPSSINVSGVREANETSFGNVTLGVAGITVTAQDQSGATVTTVTASDGSWTIPSLTGDIRVEFTAIPSYLQSSFNGTDSNTSVQFVKDGDDGIDFGVYNPASFFNSTNPEFTSVTFVTGDPLLGDPANNDDTASASAVVLFNDDDSGKFDDSSNDSLANMRDVGTTWALAYQKTTSTIFVGASIRRHAGLGALGTGGIYAVDKVNSTTTPWLDINTLAGVNTGANPRSNNPDNRLPSIKSAPSVDLNAFSAVGKIAIGDMDISEDDKTLYAIDLASRQLVAIDIASKTLSGAPIAIPTLNLETTAGICQADDVRPWAVKVHDGEVYVGVVCSAENSRKSGDLHAYVMKLSTVSFDTVLDFPLTYVRGDSGGGGLSTWEPWARTWADVHSPSSWATHVFSPIFSDIEFDIDGSLIMGFMDRGGHQIGAFNHQAIADDSGTSLEGLAQGDILRACPNVPNVLGSWTLESNGSCGGVTTAGAANNEGPGGGEFYVGDFGRGPDAHAESSAGGIVFIPGSGRLATTLMDPLVYADGNFNDVARNHGVNWLSNTDGSDKQGYVIVPFTDGDNPAGHFSKANSMGDLEALGAPAPLQIGNRVWEDTNNNGVQDPGEPGLNGVEVTLSFPGGLTAIATSATVNGVDGVYLFTDGDLTGGANIPRNSTGTITVPTTATLTDASAGNLTIAGQGTSSTDSNPNSSGSFSIATGSDGENDHTFDIGYSALPPELVSIGSIIWNDINVNGIQDADEPGIENVQVTLLDEDGIEVAGYGQVFTNSDGLYYFAGLPEGKYQVQVKMPPGYLPTINQTTVENDDENDSNIASSTGNQHTSAIFELTAGGEPDSVDSNIVDSDNADDGDDLNGNMTVDFGFFLSGPTIDIEKSTNNFDADIAADSIHLSVGEVVTWSYVVTNNGNETLTGISASDDKEGAISCPKTTLLVNESMICADKTGVAVVGNYTNTASVTGTGAVSGKSANDSDPSHYSAEIPMVKIGNLVWIEDDNDGDSATGNITAVAGVVVTATASDGTIYTDTTDANGNYLIDVPQNDTYVVTVGTPANTLPTSGSDDNSVPDTSSENNRTHDGAGTTVVVATEDNLTLDFGFVPTVKIGSLIWYEDDNDGDATTGNVTYPPAGVIVTARAADGSIYKGVTGANGSYSIEVPINGSYTVTIPPPSGYSPTAGSNDSGVPEDSSEDNRSHNGAGTVVTVGTVDNLTVDFGFVQSIALPPTNNEPIPTLSEWALMLLMMMLGLVGYRQALVRKS